MDTLALKIEDLYDDQLSSWQLAAENYSSLDKVRVKEIRSNGFSVYVQFNPGRIRSTAADTEPAAITKRPCFLCESNRPREQRGIILESGLTVLVNPFPIFNRHLTIPDRWHTPQLIKDRFPQLLALARDLPAYTVFYNGPRCGASAPDHFHFQACESSKLPLLYDFHSAKYITAIEKSGTDTVWLWHDYLRGIITFTGVSPVFLEDAFNRFIQSFSGYRNEPEEPMINCLAQFHQGKWNVHLIPRKLHRPAQYFATGDERLLLSPASVDLAGLLIVPRQEDFDRLNPDLLLNVFEQVCFSDSEMKDIISNFKQ